MFLLRFKHNKYYVLSRVLERDLHQPGTAQAHLESRPRTNAVTTGDGGLVAAHSVLSNLVLITGSQRRSQALVSRFWRILETEERRPRTKQLLAESRSY